MFSVLSCVWSARTCFSVVIEAIHTPRGPPHSPLCRCSRSMDLAVLKAHTVHLVGHSTDAVIHSHSLCSLIFLDISHRTTPGRHLPPPCSPCLRRSLLVWVLLMSSIILLLSVWASSGRQGSSVPWWTVLLLLRHVPTRLAVAPLVIVSLVAIQPIRA